MLMLTAEVVRQLQATLRGRLIGPTDASYGHRPHPL